jgi:hypothetical protein
MRKITCAFALAGLLTLGCVQGPQLSISIPPARESGLSSFEESRPIQALKTALTILFKASTHS